MYRIIICEDEFTVRRGLVMTTPWGEMNCEVIGEAENGKDGLEMIKRLTPDIVITDIQMPIMNGLEMMEQVNEVYQPAFIVLTAFSHFEYAQKALKLGAIDYLLKPFKDEDLSNAIKQAKDSIDRIMLIKGTSNPQTDLDPHNRIEKYLSTSIKSKHENIIKIIEFIHSNYHEDIGVLTASDRIMMSESYVNRLFREETDYTFHEYLTLYRIKKSCEMLKDSNVRISEVASRVGYKDQRYFSVVFKKYMGMSPKIYKEMV